MEGVQMKKYNDKYIDCLAFCESDEVREQGILAICDSSGVITFYSFKKQTSVKLFCFELYGNIEDVYIERIGLEMRGFSMRFIVQRQSHIVSSEWFGLNLSKSFEENKKNDRPYLDIYYNGLVDESLENISAKRDINENSVGCQKELEDDDVIFIYPKLSFFYGSFSSPSYFFFENINNTSESILRFDNNGNVYLSVLNKSNAGDNNEMPRESDININHKTQWDLMNKLNAVNSSSKIFNVIQTLNGYVVLKDKSLNLVHPYNFSSLWVCDLTFHILDIFVDNSFLNLVTYDEEKRNVLFEISKLPMLRTKVVSANSISPLSLIFDNHLDFLKKKQLLKRLLKDVNETSVYMYLLKKMDFKKGKLNKLNINKQNMMLCVKRLQSSVLNKANKIIITKDLINLIKKVTLNYQDLHMLIKVALYADQNLFLTLKYLIQNGLKEIKSEKILVRNNICNLEVDENDLKKLLQYLEKVENAVGNNLLFKSGGSIEKNLLSLLRQGRVQSLLLYWRRNISIQKENIMNYLENRTIFNKLLNTIPISLPHCQVEVLMKDFLIPMVFTHRGHLEMLMDWTEEYVSKIQFSQNWPTNAIELCQLFITYDLSFPSNCYRDIRREAWMMVQTSGHCSSSSSFFNFYLKLMRVQELFQKAGVMVSLQMIDSDLVKYRLLEKTLDEVGERSNFHNHLSWLGSIDRDNFLLAYLAEHSSAKDVNKSVKVISMIQKKEKKVKGVLLTLRWCSEIPLFLMKIIKPLLDFPKDFANELKSRLKNLWMKSILTPSSSQYFVLKDVESHIRNGIVAKLSGQTNDLFSGLDQVFKLAQYIDYSFGDLVLEWMEGCLGERRFFSCVKDFFQQYNRQALCDPLLEKRLKLFQLEKIAKEFIELVYLKAISPWTNRISALRLVKIGLRMLQEVADFNDCDDCNDEDFFIFYYTNLLKDIEKNKDEVEKEKHDEENFYIKACENDLQFGFEDLYKICLDSLDCGLGMQFILRERQHYKKYFLSIISSDALDEILRKQQVFQIAIDIYKCSYEHLKFIGSCDTQLSELPFKWSTVSPYVVRIIKCLVTNLKEKTGLFEELNIAWKHLRAILQRTNHYRIIISTFASINYILFYSEHVIGQKNKKENYPLRSSKTDFTASSSSLGYSDNHHSNEQDTFTFNKQISSHKLKLPLVWELEVLKTFLDSYFNQSYSSYVSHVYMILTSFFIFSQAVVAFSDLFKSNNDKSHSQFKITEVMMLYTKLQHVEESSFTLLYVNAQWLNFCSIYNTPFAYLHYNNHPSTLVSLVMHSSVDFSVIILFMRQFKVPNQALSCLFTLLSALQKNKRQRKMVDYTKKLMLLIKIMKDDDLPLKKIINKAPKLNIIELFLNFLPQEDKVFFYRSIVDFTKNYADSSITRPSMMYLIDQAPSIVSSHVNSFSLNSWLTVHEYLGLNVDDILLTCVRNDLKSWNYYSDDMNSLISYIEDPCKSLKLLTWLREDMKEINENMMEELVSTCLKCNTDTSSTAANIYKKQLQQLKLIKVFAKHGFHSSINTHNKIMVTSISGEDTGSNYSYISLDKDSFEEANCTSGLDGGWMCAIKRLLSQSSISSTCAYEALQDLVHTLCLNSDMVYMELIEECLNSHNDEHLELLDYLFYHLDVTIVQRILFRYINKNNESTSFNLCRGSKKAIGVLRALRCLCRVSTPADVLRLMRLDDVQSLVELLTDLMVMCILPDRKETFDAFRLMDKHSLARSLLMHAEKSNEPFISLNVATMISCYRIEDASMTCKVLSQMNLHGLFQSASAFLMHRMADPNEEKKEFTKLSLKLFSNALTHYHYNFNKTKAGSCKIDENEIKFRNILVQCFNVLVCIPGCFSIWLQEKINKSERIKDCDDEDDNIEVIKCMDLLKFADLTDLRVCFSILCKDNYGDININSRNNFEKEMFKNTSYTKISSRIDETLKILHEANPPTNLFLLYDLFLEHIPKHLSHAFSRLMVEEKKKSLLLDHSLMIADCHSFLEASYNTINDLSITIFH